MLMFTGLTVGKVTEDMSCERMDAESTRPSRHVPLGEFRSICSKGDCVEGLVCCGRPGSRKPAACSDVNECWQDRCDQVCINQVGSFICDCDQGYMLADDGVSCISLIPAVEESVFGDVVNDMMFDEDEAEKEEEEEEVMDNMIVNNLMIDDEEAEKEEEKEGEEEEIVDNMILNNLMIDDEEAEKEEEKEGEEEEIRDNMILNNVMIDGEEAGAEAEEENEEGFNEVVECPDNYILNPVAGTCVQLHAGSLGWQAAKSHCEANGETLAIFPTKEDFDWYTQLRTVNKAWRKAKHVWIGARLDYNNVWVWDGRLKEKIAFFAWHKYEASGRGRCLQFWYFKMDDTPCDKKHKYFACERALGAP